MEILRLVKTQALLLHNTEPHATASVVTVESQRSDLERHSEWQLKVAEVLLLPGLGSEMS